MASTPDEAAPAAPAPAAPSPRRTVHRSFRLACGLGAAVAVGVILTVLGAMVSEQGLVTPHVWHTHAIGLHCSVRANIVHYMGALLTDGPSSAPVCACRGC